MTPSQQCKQAGLKSLAELAEITERPVRTLEHWHKTQPTFFRIVLNGAVAEKFHQPA